MLRSFEVKERFRPPLNINITFCQICIVIRNHNARLDILNHHINFVQVALHGY